MQKRYTDSQKKRLAGSESILNAETFVPVALGWVGSRSRVGSPTWKLSEPQTTFMEASSHKHHWSLTPLLALLTSADNGGGRAANSKLLLRAWSLWCQEDTQSHLFRTKALLPPRKFKSYRNPVSGIKDKEQYKFFGYFTMTIRVLMCIFLS